MAVEQLQIQNTVASKKEDKTRYDYLLIVVVTTLLLVGLMMVYSTTFAILPDRPTYFFTRQLMWAGIGIAAMVLTARTPYTFWRRLSVPMMVCVLVLLLAVLVFGPERFGAQRSILQQGSVQPSELAKLVIILYIADWTSSKGEKIRQVTYGLIPFGVMLGFVTGLIILQPDFGTAVLIVSTALVMFFLAGADLLQLAIGSVVSGATLVFLISQSSYASERMRSFMEGMIDPVGLGNYQVRQALIALGFGGVFGRGLGQSSQKLRFLPMAHTDSIFAVLGEELGLIGCLVVVALFTALAYRGFRIALKCPDSYGMVLAAGLTSWLIVEALINVGVVTASGDGTAVITASAPDAVRGGSHQRTAQVTVERAQLAAVSSATASGTVNTALASPLEVRLVRVADGSAVADSGIRAVFATSGSAMFVRTGLAVDTELTDNLGHARAAYRLGRS